MLTPAHIQSCLQQNSYNQETCKPVYSRTFTIIQCLLISVSKHMKPVEKSTYNYNKRKKQINNEEQSVWNLFIPEDE